jgi:uncharacterized protein (UPF0210 family)
MDRAAREVGVNFIGGFSALVHKGTTSGDDALLASIPEALAITERVCASVNVGTTRAGINMDAVARLGEIICDTAVRTADRHGIGCAKLVVFCNAVDDNPFMAGAFHGIGEPECVINVGVSGPGVVCMAVKKEPDADFGALASIIKRTAFKVTRMGELWAGPRRRSSPCRSESWICRWLRHRRRATAWPGFSKRWGSSAWARTARPRRWRS